MFEFIKEFDEEIYNEIINEVEFNIWNDRCISIIQSEIEKIIKKLFKESDIVITNKGEDGVIYREYNPSLSRLFDKETDFRNFLFENNILNESDIESYWIILKNRNIKDHGARTGEKLVIDDAMKESALKFLFKLCYNVYTFKFHKAPNAYWDEKYFQKLLIKPEEKTIEVEKIVEKEIKVVDDVELNKLKREHEELKHKFDTIQKSTTPTATNFELINKLEIANKCLQNGDFKNAKIAFNNCRTLDISCIDAYIGLIICDYYEYSNDGFIDISHDKSITPMEILADYIDFYKEIKPLKENENYINMNNFCDKKLVEKFNKEIKETIHYVKFEKPYQNALSEYDNKEYLSAYRDFQFIHEYKDASEKSKELLSILEQDAKKYEKDKWYQRAINEYNSLKWKTKEQKLLEYIESRINEIQEKKKNEEENLIVNEKFQSVLNSEYFSHKFGLSLVKNLIIKEGITCIEKGAFGGFSALETIILPDSLKEVKFNAFSYGCGKLKYNIKNGYKYLGSEKNPYKVLIEAKNFDVNLLADTTEIISHHSIINQNLKEIEIPKSVKSICQDAFYGAPNIEKIIVNHEMRQLGGFSGCSVKTIELNAPVDEIGDYAFSGCDLLNDFTAFKNCSMHIGKDAFNDCQNLRKIDFSQIDDWLWLGEYTFDKCINLQNVNLNKNISIKRGAFLNCKNLVKVNICGCDYLEENAFSGCENLKEVFIDNSSITSTNTIPRSCFENCINLEKFVCTEKIRSVDAHAFENCKKLASLHFLENLSEIGAYAFQNCENLKNSLILNNIKNIGAYAFANSGIEKIEINSNRINKIDKWAFEECKNLKEFIFPSSSNGFTKIESGLFKSCTALENIKIPNYIVEIDRYAFSDCKNLKNIILPNKLNVIGNEVFANCVSLEKIELPNSIEYLDSYCFWGCKNLKEINIPQALYSLKSGLFAECENLEKIFIPKNIYQIDPHVFKDCSNLKQITIESDNSHDKIFFITSISGCKSLEHLEIPECFTKIFSDSCFSLSDIHYFQTLVIKKKSFYSCKLDLPNNFYNLYEKQEDNSKIILKRKQDL